MNRKHGGREESEPALRAELRARLESWPRERLLDFAVERLLAEPELRRVLAGQRVPIAADAALSQRLRRAIDEAVGVRYVDWRELPSYIGRLERLLGDIRSFAEGYPAEGVAVLRYFVKVLPRVFDSIADEDELALFCSQLARVALGLAARVAGAARVVAEELLAAWLADEHGRFSEVPELLVEAELAADVRREVAAAAEALALQAARKDSHKSRELGSLAARLR
ncbi:hypothetical protein [Archangium lansingense]|uniref:Uncharacterized protein n=1 Tax=Archangium lansingense TaxID=2995310 RepID=A0ABT4ACE5_9BACT|nr:hypothetical protein [Archangium lansinium]MCY1078579.1 hypothetical protein [Archangium lansinium]